MVVYLEIIFEKTRCKWKEFMSGEDERMNGRVFYGLICKDNALEENMNMRFKMIM